MAFCANCGSEIEAGSAFCGSCGAAAPAEAAPPAAPTVMTPPPAAPPTGMPPTPPPAAAPPAYGPPAAPMPSPAYSQPSGGGGGGKIALIAIIAVLGIGIVVVLLLGFAVGPKWFVSDGEVADVEKVVDNFLKAMETKNAKLLVSTLPPSTVKEIEDEISDYGDYDDIEEFFEDVLFSYYESMKFSGVKYQTTIKGDKATVNIVGGTLTMVDEYGDKTTEDAEDSDTSEIQLIKENGKWYIDYENM
jgi:hypothetical protein